MPEQFTLRIETPAGEQMLTVPSAQRDMPLTQVLSRRSIPLNTRCGGRGLCDGCLVELLNGQVEHIATGKKIAVDTEPIVIRACEYRLSSITAPVHMRITARHMLVYEPQVVADFRLNVPRAHDPLLPMPDPVEPGRPPLGVAIDIGTTTVALLLVDMVDGRILDRRTAFNRQIQMGDDVLTRITLCMNNPQMLQRLQRAVVEQTITPLLGEAMEAVGAGAAQIRGFLMAGNTTMLHLLTGVDPSPLGVAPFEAVFLDHRRQPASSIGLVVPQSVADADKQETSDPPVHLLPGAAAYIGSDITAGVWSSGLAFGDGPAMLVDVGTNGEIILRIDHQLVGCATAAGPAFEGTRLASGMRAGSGAISHLQLGADGSPPTCDVIGDITPAGMCGSAYVDFLAEGIRGGLLNAAGRFADDQTAHPLQQRDGYGWAYPVANDGAARPIHVTETDIASLLQAKAAIAAGIVTLLRRFDLQPGDIERLYLAGGFGMHLDITNAIACGLLPGFQPHQVELVGNTALAGAYAALLDRSALDDMTRIAAHIQTVELNLDPNCESTYLDQLSLPV
jgi:uncharacterized 2Fe-2S/4Fe-4S cluster protein (DUF4445 family)